MKNIIFIAPPAAGKGTQSDLLVKKYNYEHISLGELLREEINSGSDFGKEIDEIVKAGILVPDEKVSKLITKRLSNVTGPFILDGYPRNINQVETLENILADLKKDTTVVIYLNVSKEETIRRTMGRLICPECNATYHKYDEEFKPKLENMCDNCSSELVSRSDDTEDTFKVRYETYISNVSQIIEFYKEKGVLKIIDNPHTPSETFARIEAVIK